MNNSNQAEVLILIDIQNNYFSKGDWLLHKPEKAAQNAAKILAQFRKDQQPVIFIRHRFTTDESQFFLQEIHDLVKPLSNEIVIDKNYPSSFLETDLDTTLTNLHAKKLVICGMMSHMCVDTTVRAAQNYHYEVTLIEDACTTKHLNWKGQILDAEIVHKVFMASLDSIFANVLSTKDFLQKHTIPNS